MFATRWLINGQPLDIVSLRSAVIINTLSKRLVIKKFIFGCGLNLECKGFTRKKKTVVLHNKEVFLLSGCLESRVRLFNGQDLPLFTAVELVMVAFYIFHSARDSKAMSAIRAGMQEWTSKTCIRFKRRTNERAYANFKLGSG